MFIAQGRWSVEIEEWDYLKNPDISIVVGNMKPRIAAARHNQCGQMGEMSSGWWNTAKRMEYAGTLV